MEKVRPDRSVSDRRRAPNRPTSDQRRAPNRPTSDQRRAPNRPASDQHGAAHKPASDQHGAAHRPASDQRKTRSHPERTCVGCGKHAHPSELVRLVVSPDGEVAVDLAGGHFGRGAYVHPSLACVSGAGKGLCRSLHANIVVHPEDLARQITEGVERRIWGLLSSAVRSRQVAAGSDSVSKALAEGSAPLVIVACDAAAAASVSSVVRAVAEGRAIAFGTKDGLGALFARPEVGVLAITSAPLAAAIRAAAAVAIGIPSVRSDSDHPTAKATQNATTAEDR